MIGDVVTGAIVAAPYAGTDTFRVEIRRNGIATSGHLVNRARMAAFVAQRLFATLTVSGQPLDLSDHLLDIPPYFEGDRAEMVAWLESRVEHKRLVVEQYTQGIRSKVLDAAGRAEMLEENKKDLAEALHQLRLNQLALSVGL